MRNRSAIESFACAVLFLSKAATRTFARKVVRLHITTNAESPQSFQNQFITTSMSGWML